MTSLREARNLGPVSAEALVAAGVRSLEDLRAIGWEEAWDRLASRFPAYSHLNMGRALAGAVLNCDWRELPVEDLDALRTFQKRRRARWLIAPRGSRSTRENALAVK
jgi:hypothetical protein